MKKVKANRVMGKELINRLFILCYFCLILRVCGTVYYVTSGGDDQQDALSWETAAASIQLAMDRASPGDQVWVASGMYHPREKRQTLGSNSIFMYSFQLRDGVSLFGGFTGSEQAAEERQRLDQDGNGVLEAWEFASETILAGQPDFPGQVIYGGLQAFTVPLLIDGFSISAGDACGKGRDGEGGGALLPGSCTLQGCRIFRNKARRGGGVALNGAALVRQCLLQNNELYLEGWAGEGAGALLAGEGAGLENTLVIDNGVENSGAYTGGGGVAVQGAGSVDFCTIVGNVSTGEGSGIRYVGEGGTLRNSVIWGNRGHSCQLSTEETQIQNCAVQSCQTIPGCISLNSANCGEPGAAVNENLLHCYFPCFNAPECGDFRLAGGSYLLNRAMESSGEDAANQPRTQNQYADIGCFESALPGNLSADFQLAMPLLYAESSLLNYRLGIETPEAVEASFSAIGGTAQKLNSASDEWQLTCTQNGVVEITLQLQVSAEIAAFWNPFVFSRSLPILPKSLLLKAADLTWQWASDTPVLTWQLLYGELSGEDAIIGNLQTAIPNGLGDYPIEQGTLRVSDSAEGTNYALQFLPGVLTCIKGNTEIQFSGMEKSYTANPIEITVQTQPPDLAVSLTYQGIEETLYPETATPPVNAGKYRVTASVNEELYEGVASAILQVHKASLLCQAVDQEREYLRENPTPMIRYTGFLGQDNQTDIIPPMAFAAADHFSPVTEAGYEIILQGGSAQNYQLELRNGRLWIREMQALTNEALLSVGVYGMPLKQILIMAYAISPIDGSYLSGNFVWDQEDQVLDAGLWQCTWHFVPDEQNYQGIAGQSLVTIEQREVRVAALPKAKQYGDSDPVLEYRVKAGSLVAGDRFSGGLLRDPGENVGSFVIRQGSLALHSNYELIFTEENFSIHPRRIQLLAEDASKYEGQPDPVLLWHCVGEGPLNGDAFSGTLQREEGEEAGHYSILQGDLRISDNYLIDYQPGTLVIMPPVYRLSGDLQVARLVYGQALTGDILQGDVEKAATGEVVPGHFCWDEEGSYPETGTLLAAWSFVPDLDIGFPELNGSLELQVEKAVLQVSIQGSPSRKYGEENPLFELHYEGFVFAQDSGVLQQQPEITCSAEQNSLPGNYEILIAAGLADNYEFQYNPAFLRIEPWLIQVQAQNQQKDFAQADPEWTFVYQGNLLENDSFSGQLQRQPGERPGQYLIRQGSLSLPVWYQLDFQTGYLSIGRAPLTVKADDQSIYYGDKLPILTYQISSGALLEGDSMAGGLSCEWEKRPGTYTISRGNLTAGSQYQITFLPGILEVLPCPLTVQALNQEKFYSLADPNRPLSWEITAGRLISPDTISGILEREPGEEPGEYRIRQGSMAVSPANYYQLNFLEGVFLIKKIVPNGLAFPLNVIYHGDTVLELSYQRHFYDRYSNVELSGTCYWPTAEERLRRGTASRSLIFLPDDSVHYDEATTSLLVQIRPRALELNAENKLMIYGDSVPDLTWNIGGFELFPDEEITGELELLEVETGLSPDFDSPLPVGEYRILQGSMLPPSDDYRFLFREGRLSVNKRVVVIQAVDTSKIAETADPELEFVICEGTLVAEDQFSGQLTRAPGTLPGNYPIQQGTLALNENYELQFMEGVFSILPGGNTRSSITEYGTSPPRISASDGRTHILENPNFPDAAFDFGESLVLTGEEELEEEEPEILRIQALACAKCYGEVDSVFQYRVLSGGENGIVLQGQLQRQPGEEAGTYIIQQGSLHCPTGERLQFSPAEFTIHPRKISVSGKQQQKYQGEVDPVFTWAVEEPGHVGLQFQGRLSRSKGEQPGTYAIRRGTLQVDGRNYSLDYKPGLLTILPPAFLAVGISAESLVYGQKLQDSQLIGKVIFTDGQVVQQGHFAWQQPDCIPGSGSITAAWNFFFADPVLDPLQGECQLIVTPKPLQIKGLRQEKRQGQEDPQLLFEYPEKELLEEHPLIHGKLQREKGEVPGFYATKLGDLSFGPDYRLSFTPGTLLIQANEIIVSAEWQQKQQNGMPISFAGQNFLYGSDAFSQLVEAFERIAPGGKIRVLPGEYASSCGVWILDKGVQLLAVKQQEKFPILQSTLEISGASAREITIEGFAFIQEQPATQTPLLKIHAGASAITLQDNIFLGGNPSVQVAGVSDLTLRNNILESPTACLMFGSPDQSSAGCRGILLLNNVMRASPNASADYRHILLYDEKMNDTGILPGWNNIYGEVQVSGQNAAEILLEIKKQIADREQVGWKGKGEVRLHKKR